MKFGNQRQGLILKYPDDSLQSSILPDPWWIEVDKISYQRGRLVKVFAPHIDQQPFSLIPIGRTAATVHNQAHIKIVPLNVRELIRYPKLPVAGFPQYDDEIRIVYRAKKRPALIVSRGGPAIKNNLTENKAKWQTAPTILVAPFYGADEGPKRSGFKPSFIERIRRCEYPQFMWDMLPFDTNTKESILRLDHLQPIGRSQDAVEITKYCLSDLAMDFIDEWLCWLITGDLDEDSLLGDFREKLLNIPYHCKI